MLSVDFIRNNQEKVLEAAKNKNREVDIDKIIKLDHQKLELIHKIQKLREKRNQLAKQPHSAQDKQGFVRGKKIKEELKGLEQELKGVEPELIRLLYLVPNIPFAEVPIGKDETENKVIRKWGVPKKFQFDPKDHVKLGELLDVIDIKTASKVVATRFAYIKNELAVLEYALVLYVFQLLINPEKVKEIADSVKVGYHNKTFIPVVPPVMINPDTYRKMARLDETQEIEKYHLQRDNLYLIGSAEHTLGAMHMDQTFFEQNLPLRYIGFSTSFRREAGSYGKDTKGILRVHQFDKIEMESFTIPEDSKIEQDFFVAIQEYLMKSLEIPYQVVMICTGDMGTPDARQLDIEAWLPGQNKYRETHTSDLMTDYQARRLNTKVKLKSGKTEFVHMNDATAFAIGRTLIAILENYQQKDGSVLVPKVLQALTGFDKIMPKKT